MTTTSDSAGWDVFRAYRENFAYNNVLDAKLPNYCLVVQTDMGMKLALSKYEYREGDSVTIETARLHSSNGWVVNDPFEIPLGFRGTGDVLLGRVLACFSRHDMTDVNLLTANPLQIAAIGEFMAGQTLLPLFVTDMLLHLQSCLQRHRG